MSLPFVLSSGVVSLAQTTTSLPVDSARLALPFRAPSFIDEIRFHVATPLPSGGATNIGSYVQVQLGLGRRSLIDGFAPIAVLTPASQDSAENSLTDQIETGTVENSIASHRWILPRPLYLRPGEGLSATFKRITDNLAKDVLIEMAMAGRTVDPGGKPPRTRSVPWVTTYVNNKVAASSSQGSGQSQTALYNPFTVPLNVQRFVGRSYQDAGSGQLLDGGSAIVTVSDAAVASRALVTMSDNARIPMVKDATVFGEVFDLTRRAWTAPRVLPPKGWVQVQITNAPTDFVYWIGMIGWVEEALS